MMRPPFPNLWAAALLCLVALPAQAQDFRGLLPGMATAELARLGEPFEHASEDGFTAASYPLPFERTLDVIHADGMIAVLSLSVRAGTRMRPPETSGLQVGETSLREAIALAGSEGYAFKVLSSLPALPPSGWVLWYTLPDHPDLVLGLTFYGRGDPTLEASDFASVSDMPQDATLIGASLSHRSLSARYPVLADLQVLPPSHSTPFALPLAEAFPLIEIPQ